MEWADATALTPGPRRPGVKRLIRTDDTTVIAFAFAAGQEWSEHTAAHPILLTCARGSLTFTAHGESRQVAAGQVLRLDARVPHAVVADEDTLMLLTMLHQPEATELPAPATQALDQPEN